MPRAPLELVAASSLFVSEPAPYMFGNPANEETNAAWSRKNWLQSRFHFSFAEYHSHDRTNFGVLRVMNDDIVQPRRGFGAHPHRDMEIVTYVVEGELTHQDSMGQKETLGAGSIQFMTAGRGVTHSEHNLADRPLRFIQIWIQPRERGLPPNYGSYDGADKTPTDWTHLVSDVKSAATTPVKINQDANVFVVETSAPRMLSIESGRQAYLLCVTGDATADVAAPNAAGVTQRLTQHDAARLFGPVTLTLTPNVPTTALVVEMALA